MVANKTMWHFCAEVQHGSIKESDCERGSGLVETERNPQFDSKWYDELKLNILSKLNLPERFLSKLIIVSLTRIESEPPPPPKERIKMFRNS